MGKDEQHDMSTHTVSNFQVLALVNELENTRNVSIANSSNLASAVMNDVFIKYWFHINVFVCVVVSAGNCRDFLVRTLKAWGHVIMTRTKHVGITQTYVYVLHPRTTLRSYWQYMSVIRKVPGGKGDEHISKQPAVRS